MKKILTMLIVALMVNSCYYLDVMLADMKTAYIKNQTIKKDGESAFFIGKYTEGVKAAIKDVANRPLTEQIRYGKLELIIPENTKIKKISDNIVDKKTGYGLQIVFNKSHTCNDHNGYTFSHYSKKIGEGEYYDLVYNKNIEGLEEIAQKIIKANGFTKGCK